MVENIFVWPVRIYYEDTDRAGVVYFANYLKFMERARTEWLRALGWSQEKMVEHLRVVFVVAEVKVRYLRPAHLDDRLEVRTRLSDCKRASFGFAQEIYRGEELLVKSEVRCGVLNAETFRPTAMPEELVVQLKQLLN